ncbi:hypothetical protein [Streptomyces platensis]|uniref:hypothetical protein n=1 Tax=Streptomyces platensis TaxID=58346 RepID=UPI003867E8A8|nr:hypothetical protein OG962_06050 [Streptomyces platensis]
MVNSHASLDDDVAIAAACAGADVVRDMYGQRLTRIDKGGGFLRNAKGEVPAAALAEPAMCNAFS